jgi:hypothetical protein
MGSERPLLGEGAPLSASLGVYGSSAKLGGDWDVARRNLVPSDGGVAESVRGSGVPSLQTVCQRAVAVHLVEPRTALQLLEYAELAGSEELAVFCKQVRTPSYFGEVGGCVIACCM